MFNIPWFPHCPIVSFPEVETALDTPDGLLALGGDLSLQSLLAAYENGIFPWFSEDEPIAWWIPSERAVIDTNSVHVSKNLMKKLNQNLYTVTADKKFQEVVRACAQRDETWITPSIQEAYLDLHQKGFAHSVEVLDENNQLAGGLYGVFVKNCFCGESMVSHQRDASKIALVKLAQFLAKNGCTMIDCQLPTDHLMSMGAKKIKRMAFVKKLKIADNNTTLLQRKWDELWQHC